MEGRNDVRGRGVAPLAAVLFEGRPLVVEVERKRAGIALRGFEDALFHDHEGKARDALNALVGRGNDDVEIEPRNVDVDGAEGAHRVDDHRATRRLHDAGDRRDVVQKTRRRFVVHHRHHRHFGVRGQVGFDRGGVGRFGPVEFKRRVGDFVAGEDFAHALRVGAVDENEHVVVRAGKRTQHGFDAERARALHEDRRVVVARVRDFEKTRADVLRHRLVVVVPGAAVDEHRFAHREGGGERAGSEELVGVGVAVRHGG